MRARMRRWLLRCASGLFLGLQMGAAHSGCNWPAWTAFQRLYLSDDGRVIDRASDRQRTVSEGQAYALFFALVANDRDAFDRILRWTEDNLAQGDLSAHLPAWLWGRRDDDSWAVIDSNPASDADLWIAYTLAEAGHLWQERRYRVLAKLVGRNLLREETATVPDLGPTLLPGPVGFIKPEGWRLNPSYVPLQLLRGLSQRQPDAGWEALLPGSRRLLHASAPQGYAPDWVLYDKNGQFQADAQTAADGSYDAIRVYLWAGMLHRNDPDREALVRHLRPMAQATAAAGAPPEHVNTQDGTFRGSGFPGYSAALLPLLTALGDTSTLERQRKRVAARFAEPPEDAYYESVLTLFGTGWDQRHYRFAADGTLRTRWQTDTCSLLS